MILLNVLYYYIKETLLPDLVVLIIQLNEVVCEDTNDG